MKKVLIVADAQAPYYHKPSLKILQDFADDFNPSHLIDLGDRGDFRSLSKWSTDVEKASLKLTFQQDKDAFIGWGDALHKALPKKCEKIILKGNHDIRPEKFITEQPVLDGVVEIETYLKQNKYTVIPHGYYHNIGHLYFHHGDEYSSQNHAKQYATRTGKSVAYGHHHEFQTHTVHHLDFPHAAFSIGMMGDKEQLRFYMQGKPSSWQNGFAFAYIDNEGHFSLYPVIITNNKTIIQGKVYHG